MPQLLNRQNIPRRYQPSRVAAVAPHVYAGAAAQFVGGALDVTHVIRAQVTAGAFDLSGTGLTAAAWVWALDPVSSSEAPLSHIDASGHGWTLVSRDPSGRYGFGLYNLAGSFAEALVSGSYNAWHLLIATYDGAGAGSMKLYLDNGTPGTATAPAFNYPANVPFAIGSIGWGGVTFKGILDSIGIWSRVLSGTEIGNLWNSGTGLAYYDVANTYLGLLTGLTAWYDCDDGGGQNLVDASGAGLTLLGQNGASTYTSVAGKR